MLVFNEFYIKLKTIICLIFNFTNRKSKFISPLQLLTEFLVVMNNMSGKKSEPSLTGADVRVQTDSRAMSEYRRQRRTHPLAMERHAR